MVSIPRPHLLLYALVWHSVTSPSHLWNTRYKNCNSTSYQLKLPSWIKVFHKVRSLQKPFERRRSLWTMILGDSFMKMAITLLPDFPKLIELEGKPVSSERYLYEAISNMISTLVTAPVRRRWLHSSENQRPFALNLGQSRSRCSLSRAWFKQCDQPNEMLGGN